MAEGVSRPAGAARDEDALTLAIRPLAAEDLPLLEQFPSGGLREKHRERLARQEAGEAVYLVAWDAGLPVGHLLLKWGGAGAEPMASRLRDCPAVEDFTVRPEYRSQGVGSHLLDTAEGLARGRGFERIGLSVGVENTRARALYERRGYADAGLGEHTVRWPYIDREGQRRWGEEHCVFLVKSL